MANANGKHAALTYRIIAGFYAVHNALGCGFSETIYHQALLVELRSRNMDVVSEAPIHVYYHGQPVGHFFADLVVNGVVILELKAVEELEDVHRAQLLNYLKSTEIEVGLLLNFGATATD